VVLYWSETWSLILSEEHTLRVLRRIFGPKRDEVTGDWRKLHKEELHELDSSLIVTRMITLKWACSTHEREESGTKLLIGKRPIGGPRHRWVDSIVMDLIEIGWRLSVRTGTRYRLL
jgi:hypothetical protein